MFTPAISPADPNRMMVNCDMSAAYISADGGRSWRMIHYSQLRTNTRCRPAFHPTDRNVVYAADGGSGRLKLSRDGGMTWQLLSQLPSAPHGEIAIDPGSPERMLAGTNAEGGAIYRSTDAGKTWTRCEGPRGEPLSFHFDQTSSAARRVCFAGTREGIWRSDDGGATWAKKMKGLPMQVSGAAEGEGGILAFAGGSNAAKREAVLYCSVPGRVDSGQYAGGLYRSADRGETWQWAMGEGLNKETKAFDEWANGPVPHYRKLLTTDANPRAVYAFNSSTGVPPPHDATCYRSDDAGKTWRAAFQADPRFPGLNVERDYTVHADRQAYGGVPLGVAICATDPDRLITVDTEKCYITDNGGRSWRAGHTQMAAGSDRDEGAMPRWLCSGLVVTSTWNYYVDPFRKDRHYIAYTDIGFAASDDAGKSWRWWAREGRPPWKNTTYELAFDPETPGRMWGAFSNTHDIPNGNIIHGRHRPDLPGGVCVSDDYGQTWKVSSQGLPAAPVVSVVIDPRSPKAARILYAGVFERGVYKSMDNGKTWTAKNNGLGAESNRRVCRVVLHTDGTLFALVTAKRQGRGGPFLPEGVGLYRSTDGGERWSLVNAAQPLLWPKDVTVDPKDSRIIYIGAADAGAAAAAAAAEQGGLYRTKDGGATWQKLARKGPEHFGAYLHPTRPGWIYMTLTEGAPDAGLWLSRDDGATWEALRGLPFSNAQRVAFVPSDPERIYVTTFGGSIWRGPAAAGTQ